MPKSLVGVGADKSLKPKGTTGSFGRNQGLFSNRRLRSSSRQRRWGTVGDYPVAKTITWAPGRASFVWRRGWEFEVALRCFARAPAKGPGPLAPPLRSGHPVKGAYPLQSPRSNPTGRVLRCCRRYGGEGGIRTHGPFQDNGFRDRPIRPLSHLSAPWPMKTCSLPWTISRFKQNHVLGGDFLPPLGVSHD